MCEKRILTVDVREDFKAVYLNNRPMLAKMNEEWVDPKVFEKYLESCKEECQANKTYGYTIHIYVAQKPAN